MGRTESEPRRVACAKHIEDGEHFFGFGERTGPLDKLGRQLINWTTDPAHGHGPGTDPLYQAIPVFMALRPGLAYGVFFNSTWRSRFDIGAEQPGVWRMEADGGELDYLCDLWTCTGAGKRGHRVITRDHASATALGAWISP